VVEGRGRAYGGASPVREELLKLQVGQCVRVQIRGEFHARKRVYVDLGAALVDTRMLERPHDPFYLGEEVCVWVRGYVRTIGRKGGLLLEGGAFLRSSVPSNQVLAVEVVR
jgi:hypothetical protein